MKIQISGMHCQACVRRVQKAIEALPDAKLKNVEVGSAEVDIEPQRESAVIDAIRKAGYEPQPLAV